MHFDTTSAPAAIMPGRRWQTVEQMELEFPAFTKAAFRSLTYRSRAHYNHRGEWVEGNGLANAICQPGGKNGKVLIDAIAFGAWLEQWVGLAEGRQLTRNAA